jgi:hypothetical protein
VQGKKPRKKENFAKSRKLKLTFFRPIFFELFSQFSKKKSNFFEDILLEREKKQIFLGYKKSLKEGGSLKELGCSLRPPRGLRAERAVVGSSDRQNGGGGGAGGGVSACKETEPCI